MKKSYLHLLFLTFIILICVGCGQSNDQSSSQTPDQVVDNFLKELTRQNYASAKTYYAENLDNLANFRNQVEDISPGTATALFNKMSDFSYTINSYEIDPKDPNKATVSASILAYDLGKSFEATVLEYIQTDLEMTFDGAKSDDIIKKAEEVVVQEINNSKKTFSKDVTISLTKENDTWKLDKIGNNTELINALCGNIIHTIENISAVLDTLPTSQK